MVNQNFFWSLNTKHARYLNLGAFFEFGMPVLENFVQLYIRVFLGIQGIIVKGIRDIYLKYLGDTGSQ